MALKIFNLKKLINEIGEKDCKELFVDFLCTKNPDVEYFLKHKAILFSQSDIARTYLVYTSYKKNLVLAGYFALAQKPLLLSNNLSKTQRKLIVGSGNGNISEISTFLIGQLGKNEKYSNLITGTQLLNLAFLEILKINFDIGGRLILVECENHPKLLRFYSEEGGFKLYKNEPDGLVQLIRKVSTLEYNI